MEEKFTLSLIDDGTGEVIPLEQIEIEIRARSAMVIENIIAIGRMLIGVKERMEHGQFSNWLRDRIEYSQSTANNFMRLAREIPYTPTLASLPYTKALAMLDVPAEEREQFISENKVDDIPSRKLRELIKERDAAQKEADRQRQAADRSAGLADQYSTKYYEAQEQLNILQTRLESTHPPEPVEIPVEVIPPDYEEIKAALEREKRRADAAEAYAEQVDAAYSQEHQKAQRARMQQIDAEGALADPYSPKELRKAVDGFMGAMGILPNMATYFSSVPPERMSEYSAIIDTVEAWVKGVRAITRYEGFRIIDSNAAIK